MRTKFHLSLPSYCYVVSCRSSFWSNLTDELFVCGTLHPYRAPREIDGAVRSLRPVGQGAIRGRLYNFGDYPGVVLDQTAGQQVPGSVYALPQDSRVLAELDRYEVRAGQRRGQLFVRVKTPIMFADRKERQCWVYVYNKPAPIQ